jgi:hypothetical protein
VRSPCSLALLAAVTVSACRDRPQRDADPDVGTRATAPIPAVEFDRRVNQVAARELTTLRAVTADELVPGAPARDLLAGTARTLPYSEGRTLQVPLLLAAGPPSRFRVPTDLSINLMMTLAPSGSLSATGRPAREDLATAVSLALAGEVRALAVASAALDAAHVALPPGARSWADALAVVSLDARVPRAQLSGNPSWHLMFGPMDPKRGWNSVLIDATSFGVTMVNGRAP